MKNKFKMILFLSMGTFAGVLYAASPISLLVRTQGQLVYSSLGNAEIVLRDGSRIYQKMTGEYVLENRTGRVMAKYPRNTDLIKKRDGSVYVVLKQKRLGVVSKIQKNRNIKAYKASSNVMKTKHDTAKNAINNVR
ncbi:MAG TPA: hypothetical protein ENG78_01935 [Acidiferrobacteraceae bacterium]|nr:hypothetical protein [Acidiferrobacteraceae bacterium]HEX19570.1 hypothetical protein [Acidiferrobacteraceae bacterium]